MFNAQVYFYSCSTLNADTLAPIPIYLNLNHIIEGYAVNGASISIRYQLN